MRLWARERFYANTGSDNTALGYQALYDNTTGHDNTGIGYQANRFITTGAYNIAIGNNALDHNTGGTYCIGIGYQSDVGGASLTNAIAIGYGAQARNSNTMVLGNGTINVGIGTTTPSQTLDVFSKRIQRSFS